MKTHQVYLTPLTPIHIGCGEEFEPTNYVIDDDVLYHFEPSKLHLTDDEKQELLEIIEKGNDAPFEIQKFFSQKSALIKQIAHYFANTQKSVADDWAKKVGNVVQIEGHNKLVNQLLIDRHSYISNQALPYIPASSVKGALITTILNSHFDTKWLRDTKYLELLNKVQKNNSSGKGFRDEDKKLIKDILNSYISEIINIDDENIEYKISESIKGVKFSDFMPVDNNVATQVMIVKNFEKYENEPAGLSLKREMIMSKQYRSFKSNLTLWNGKYDLQQLIEYLNCHFIDSLKAEMKILIEKKIIKKDILDNLLSLIENNKNIALVRLGKNGSLSKVITKLAQIETKKSKREREILPEATTFWLSINPNESLGWALLEFDPNDENIKLKDYCKNYKVLFDKADIIFKRKQLEEQKKQAIIIKQKFIEQEQQEQAKQQKLASLSGNFKIIAEKIEQWEKVEKSPQNSSPIVPEYRSLLELAFNENWSSEEKQELLGIYENKESVLWTNVDNFSLSGKNGKTPAAKKFKQALKILTDSLCN
ncbi:type III-A CRISPR-associated RAMP protein Csm5 [Pasteurella skyensis]|nr:type III-A CRISPR-associated RAMP protein Csm5 [Pasteurella skyensis]